jgi:hypothetical protein
MTILDQQVLTANNVTTQLNNEGLDALGITMPLLSATWATATPSGSDPSLFMFLTGIQAPFGGTFEFQANPVTYADVSGAPLTGATGVLAMHPEAVHRIETLVAGRLGSLDRPVPVAMLVHNVTMPAGKPLMEMYRPGQTLVDAGALSGGVTFHDRRGLIIDPVAVAGLFADLLGRFPGLGGKNFNAAAMTGTGGVSTIAGLTDGVAVRVHVVSPHGASYSPPRTGSEVQVLDSGGAVVNAMTPPYVDLQAGQGLGHPSAAGANPPPVQVLWGPSPGGTLDTATWTPPSLPSGVSLPRQFFRLVAVDLDWHVLGNRGYVPAATMPGEQNRPASAPLPQVRRTIANAGFLLDGNDVLGACGAALATFPASGDRAALLCSPAIDTTLAIPAAPGAAAHWPVLGGVPPGTPPNAAAVAAYDPTVGTAAPTATWLLPTGAAPLRDVIVTFAAGVLPVGAFVRVYPRTFQRILDIGPDPSFVRGDGTSAVVQASGPTSLLLTNPFALGGAETAPADPVLTLDIVLVALDSSRRLLTRVAIPVGAPQAFTATTPGFGGTTSAVVAGIVSGQGFTSIAPSELFGIPQLTPATPRPGAGASAVDWVRWLSNEGTWPRIGPRLPTQARFDTVLAVGAAGAGGVLSWSSVLTGGRYTGESREASPELASPGNQAGPDAHVTGLAAGGQLGHDLAFHALKRSQAVIPTGAGSPGWFIGTMGDNWNDPAADPPPAATLPHLAGAVLETIAPVTDTPELSVVPMFPENATLANLARAIENALGLAPNSLAVTFGNEARIRHQIQREIDTATRGQTEAMWSLARAVSEAREYVYVESPTFNRTADPGDTGLVDLVDLLIQRLGANPLLKVMICVPRLPDFSPGHPTWVRRAFKDRKDALEALIGADRDRVAAFHPIAFPGRSAVGRSTVVLVDDCYGLIGTSHWRRRGMSFDGGCDVALLDRRLSARGSGAALAGFRQALLATRLGVARSVVPAPGSPAVVNALWARLAEPESTFDALRDLLLAGGLGHCTPVYAGPTDTTVLTEDRAKVDPNGLSTPTLASLLGGLVP